MTTTAPQLLTARVATAGAGPLVTFYDDATGERVELSAISFANWVAKTANLLGDGLGLGPGDKAAVALPLHWQALAVIAGCWQAGLVVDLGSAGDPPRHAAVSFTTSDGAALPADDRFLLGLTPMGGRLAAPVAGAADFAAEVPGYGDRYTGPTPGPGDDALPGVTHAELCAGTAPTGDRLLLAPAGDPVLDRLLIATAYLAPLAGGGSAVICRHADATLLERRIAAEQVDTTAR